MKFKFTSQSKVQAEKFAKTIKADRNLDSTITTKDDKFFVEYSIADYAAPVSTTENETECYVSQEDFQSTLSSFAQFFYEEMQYQLNWVWSEVDYLSNAFYQHASNGHLPPINGADKMTAALKALGIDKDYEVVKPVIYASASNSFEVDFSAKK